MIRKLEINFALPVELTDDEMQRLDRFVGNICKRNCPKGWVFWPAGHGDKPIWSKADARIFGWETTSDAPETGEPSFDDTVYSIDCAARELYLEEMLIKEMKAVAAKERAARWDSRLVGWLHRRGLKQMSWWIADASFWLHDIKKRKASNARA